MLFTGQRGKIVMSRRLFTLLFMLYGGQIYGQSTVTITTVACPGGVQGSAYVGCTIAVTGGIPPYTFSVSTAVKYSSLPEGLSLNSSTGVISSPQIGGQGTYIPEIVVTDSVGAMATKTISFAIAGNNAYLPSIFPSNSIFHHRVDAATTGLPVDTSPAAPIYSGYLSATIKPYFGGNASSNYPNGIPAFEVPCNQSNVSVTTTMYQTYFSSGPFPANAPVEGTSQSTAGDRHVLIYQQGGCGNSPALWEMWQGIYEGGPWTDSSNALWSNANSNALTPQGMGTSDAAGLPVAPLLLNADEVIGTGTPTSPNGTVQHPTRFTLNHILNNWVWPATQTAGVGNCGSGVYGMLISQSSPPASCTFGGPPGEIYRLKSSVSNPSCASTSPQSSIIITAFRNYGIIVADNGKTGAIIGTPDARWNDSDLSCLSQLTLAAFEPVNVSSLMINPDSGETPGASISNGTTTMLIASATTLTFGQSVTFTATVSSVTSGTGTPTGMVTFQDGTQVLAQTSINGSTAVFSTSALILGSHSITAGYSPNSSYAASTSSPVSVTVTASFVGQPSVCPCTVWNNTTTPTVADSGQGLPVELGVQFTSSEGGMITGIRFYKSANNTGTHIGNLWDSSGNNLATATFSSETASGWQQVIFTTPVSINANTIYVASYHTTVGHYSADQNFFTTTGVNNAPLEALPGNNGVYVYGPGGVFPSNSYNSTNYWVDAVFQLP
jgi:hypothetical protein